MSTISYNRAAYQHPNVKLGQGHTSKPSRPALSVAEKTILGAIQRDMSLALVAASQTTANVHLSSAYRSLRSLLSDRVSK